MKGFYKNMKLLCKSKNRNKGKGGSREEDKNEEFESLAALFISLASAYYLNPELHSFLKSRNLTLRQFEVLQVAGKLSQRGRTNMKQIGIELNFSSGASTTNFLDHLEHLGYLIRIRDCVDRRSIMVILSSEGQRVIDEAREILKNSISDVRGSNDLH